MPNPVRSSSRQATMKEFHDVAPKTYMVPRPSFRSSLQREQEKLGMMVGDAEEEKRQREKIRTIENEEDDANRSFYVQTRPSYAGHRHGQEKRGTGANRQRRRSTLSSVSMIDDSASVMDGHSMTSSSQTKTVAMDDSQPLAASTEMSTASSKKRPKSAGPSSRPNHYSNERSLADSVLLTARDGRSRQHQELERRQADFKLMERIISSSEASANTMKQEIGGQAFSSVNAYLRGVKRTQEREQLMKMLRKIEDRTKKAKNDLGTKKQRTVSHVPTDKKNEWVDDIKERGRNSFLAHVQQQRIEEISIQAQIREEKMATSHKQELDRMEESREELGRENYELKRSITHMQEEIRSLKYTIEMMRSKTNKQLEREIEYQEKLKLFREYEPIFEDLKTNFKFPNSQAVIERMQMLEKGQTDSYTQLLEAQEQRNKMERQLEETKKKEEMKSQKMLNDVFANFDKVDKQKSELLREISDLKNQSEAFGQYKNKYLTLQASVLDLWINYVKDIERLGYRDPSNGGEVPDPANALQLVSAIKNILVAFTPTKATEEFKNFSKMANGYWLRYFKERTDLKSRPRKIFQQLGVELDHRGNEIERLKKTIVDQETHIKAMENRFNRVVRSRNALESEIRTKRPRVDSALSTTYVPLRSRSARPNPIRRPSSAPAHRRTKTALPPRRRSTSRASYTWKKAPPSTSNKFFKTQEQGLSSHWWARSTPKKGNASASVTEPSSAFFLTEFSNDMGGGILD